MGRTAVRYVPLKELEIGNFKAPWAGFMLILLQYGYLYLLQLVLLVLKVFMMIFLDTISRSIQADGVPVFRTILPNGLERALVWNGATRLL
jgi:hypothetical protein